MRATAPEWIHTEGFAKIIIRCRTSERDCFRVMIRPVRLSYGKSCQPSQMTLASAVMAEARPRCIVPPLSSIGRPALAQSTGMTVRLITSLPTGLPRYWKRKRTFSPVRSSFSFAYSLGRTFSHISTYFFTTTETGLTNAFDVFPAGTFR